MLAITLALHLCDLVHIAGFGYPDAHNRKQTIHYYEQITLKSMAVSGPCFRAGWDRAGDPWGVGVRVVLRARMLLQGQNWNSDPWSSGRSPQYLAIQVVLSLWEPAQGRELPEVRGLWGASESAPWAGEVPGSPLVCFLGCLHRGQRCV